MNKVSIIVYHDPTPKALESHLRYLSKNYNFIHMNSLIEAIYTQNWRAIPPKGLVVTIDDGHAGNYDLLKVFKRYEVKPTIYLSSHIVDTHRHFWFDVVGRSLNEFRNLSHRRFLSILEKDYQFFPDREYHFREALNRQELAEMAPWVDFQCHGRYHFNLRICDANTAISEIANSKIKIEKMLGRNCDHFAYPFGEYSNRELKYVKNGGYKSGRTTDPGWNGVHTDPYRLKISAMIPNSATENMLCAQLSGLIRYSEYLLTLCINRFKLFPESCMKINEMFK